MANPLLLLTLILLIPISFLLILSLIARPHPAKIPIKNRHVFITGGSSGIGLAIARQAAVAGARISLLARSLTKLEEARESIRIATGIDAAIFSADVRDAAAVARAMEKAGPVDVLVCNQGVFTPRELEKMEIEDVRFMMEVNVMGTFHLIKAVLPGMKRRVKETGVPGSIAMVSSQAGQVGLYGYTAYSASKFALRGLGEALQQEVVADNIHVSLIFPPDTETPGLVEENRVKPELTSLITGSSTAMKADEVAKIAINGIKSGTFIVPCNFEGFMLSIATAGLSPQSSSMSAFMEVLGAGFMRFLGLCFQWNWYNIIEKHSKKKKLTSKGFALANPFLETSNILVNPRNSNIPAVQFRDYLYSLALVVNEVIVEVVTLGCAPTLLLLSYPLEKIAGSIAQKCGAMISSRELSCFHGLYMPCDDENWSDTFETTVGDKDSSFLVN